MHQVHKTVFISYRRKDIGHARSVYQALTQQGYDCFLDYKSIHSGDWLQIILNQVAARAHFTLILTPTTLKRCTDENDILRQEIEQAVKERRNIVPLLFDNIVPVKQKQYLVSPELKMLFDYNALAVPDAFFEEAMARLINTYLNTPLELVIHPTPASHQPALAENQQKVEIMIPKPEQSQTTNSKAGDWIEKGNVAFEAEDYDLAIEFYTHAIEVDPNLAEAYKLRGDTWFIKEQEDIHKVDAQDIYDDFQKAIDLNPDYIEAYRSLADWQFTHKDYQCIDEYNHIIRLNPSDVDAYSKRGIAYRDYDESDYKKAIADFTQAIRLDPDNPVHYVNRGKTYFLNGEDRRAIQDYNQAIRLGEKTSAIYVARGRAYYYSDDIGQALEDFTEAIRIDPKHSDAYAYRGDVYLDKKEYKLAIADYETAMAYFLHHWHHTYYPNDIKTQLDKARELHGK